MASKDVAIPYATALLDVATAQNAVSKIRSELSAFTSAVERSNDLRVSLTNPTVDATDRKNLVKSLAGRMNLSDLTTNFLCLLADKRRIGVVVEIGRAFAAMADDRSGVARALVQTATKLSPMQEAQLKTALERLTGKKVVVEASVDPSLLGGLRVRVGGKLYDGSLQSHFEKLRETILQDL